MATDKRKQSVYVPDDMLEEIQEECDRQDRVFSWIMQKAWEIARGRIMAYEGVPPEPLP